MAKTTKVVRKVVKSQVANLKQLNIEKTKTTDLAVDIDEIKHAEGKLDAAGNQIKEKPMKQDFVQNQGLSLQQAIIISEVISLPRCKTRHRRGYR